MKKLIVLVCILLLTAIIGCSLTSESDFQIKISGTDGLKFSGNYYVVAIDGKSVSKSVDGSLPAEFTTKGSIVSCMFQKGGESGYLKVEILKDGKVVASESTTASYGVVAIGTD